MPKSPFINEVIEEIVQSVLATPKRQRRLKSSTFWNHLFGFERRTKERVEQVIDALRKRAVLVNIDDAIFGSESRGEWITLSYLESELPPIVARPAIVSKDVPTPADSWFRTISKRAFKSEREVEYYFVMPLLEQLAYDENDCAIGYPVQMYEGVKKVNKQADIVLFNGTSRAREDALLIVEVKKSEKALTEDAVGQANSYALRLTTPYYLVTNGQEIRVYLFRGAVQPDVLIMNFKSEDLKLNWSALSQTLNKSAVLKYKEKLRRLLTSEELEAKPASLSIGNVQNVRI